MNMNHKLIPIIISILVVAVIIVLVLIVVLANRTPKKKITFANNTDSNTVAQQNEVEQENETQDTENKTGEGTVTGEIEEVETEDGGIIPVPPTFHYIEGASESGAVIEDENGNQFVWVPVGDYNNYQRQMFLHNGEGGNTISSLEDEKIRDVNSYNEDFDDSVRNYGGFYIGRYEAGKNQQDQIVSKAGELAWTGVTWEKARELSLNMYSENDFFETDLINSYAWDTTCTWLRNTGTNIDDSTDIGNYQNNNDSQNKIVATGSSENWKTNNIYDMAGNAWEYTTEEFGEHERYHMGRGGGYWNEGDMYPISSRGQSDDSANLAIGFRVVMYLK